MFRNSYQIALASEGTTFIPFIDGCPALYQAPRHPETCTCNALCCEFPDKTIALKVYKHSYPYKPCVVVYDADDYSGVKEFSSDAALEAFLKRVPSCIDFQWIVANKFQF